MGYAVGGKWDAKQKQKELFSDATVGFMPNKKNEKEKKYPFIGDTSKICPLLWHYTSRKVLQFADDQITPDPDDKLRMFAKRSLNGWGRSMGQKIETEFIGLTPAIAAISDFSEGPSNIYSIYTVVCPTTGLETPVYFRRYREDGFGRRKEETLPTNFDETLRNNIKYVVRELESNYNDQDLKEYYREYFSEPGFDFITKGDIPDRCIDPLRLKRWSVRDASYLQQQKGDNIEEFPHGSGTYITQRNIDIDGDMYTIRRYEFPPKWNEFLSWGAMALLWRGSNGLFLFGPAKKAMMKLSKEFGQVAIEEQYKICSGINRTIFRNFGRNRYDFDLKQYVA